MFWYRQPEQFREKAFYLTAERGEYNFSELRGLLMLNIGMSVCDSC